jgi:LacI family transcriptional regulator
VTVEEADFTREGGFEGAARIMERAPATTAIAALNDAMAIGALAYLRQQGVRVPHEVSVAGFDDVPVAADLAPALTTLRLPMIEMGALALEMALRPQGVRPRRRRTPHELVVRESTAPPRHR